MPGSSNDVATHYRGRRCHRRRGGLHANMQPGPQERAAKRLPCAHGQGRRRRALLSHRKGRKEGAGRNYAEQGPGRRHRAALEGEAGSLNSRPDGPRRKGSIHDIVRRLDAYVHIIAGDLGLL